MERDAFDHSYRSLIGRILDRGSLEPTGAALGGETVRARTEFGAQVRHDMDAGFPLTMTRRLSFRTVALETAWFLHGRSDVKWLNDRGCRIWDAWAKLSGSLGPIYGVRWRRWPAPCGGFFDQLHDAYWELSDVLAGRDERARRRIIVQAWDPGSLDQAALPPCHMGFQFGVVGGRVHLHWWQRSCDVIVGLPHNVASYSLILLLFCEALGAVPGTVVGSIGDVHIYECHEDAAWEILRRPPVPHPEARIRGDSFLSFEDVVGWDPHADPRRVKLVGYEHAHDPIKVEVPV